ncbi:MAG: hypothetical protein IJ408_06825 [Clostridia bacterium]|nr:hypothetical protein [Clostridia bacterium]
MKKLLALILVLCIMLSLFGCRKIEEEQTAAAGELTEQTEQASEKKPEPEKKDEADEKELGSEIQKEPEPIKFTASCSSKAFENEQAGTHVIKSMKELDEFYKKYPSIDKSYNTHRDRYNADFFKTRFISVYVCYEEYFGIDYKVSEVTTDGKISLSRFYPAFLGYYTYAEKLVWFVTVELEKKDITAVPYVSVTEIYEKDADAELISCKYDTYHYRYGGIKYSIDGKDAEQSFMEEIELPLVITNQQQLTSFYKKYKMLFEDVELSERVFTDECDEEFFKTQNKLILHSGGSMGKRLINIKKDGTLVFEQLSSYNDMFSPTFFVIDIEKADTPQSFKIEYVYAD